MKSLMILLVSLAISSCGTEAIKASNSRPNIDREALPYVLKFERLWRRKIPNRVTVRMSDLGRPHVGGVCQMRTKQIKLNTPNWERHSKVSNETVTFHELGHCVLDRGHLYYDTKRWRCAPSIMGWKGVSDECYKKHYDYYINELFTGCRTFKSKGLK